MHASALPFVSLSLDSVVGVLMEFLNGEGAMDVILFVRSIVEQYEVRSFPSRHSCPSARRPALLDAD